MQATPEGKHFSQVLHSQVVQELVVVHPSLVATVSGQDLYSCLTEALMLLARATAEDGEVEEGKLESLPGTLLLVRDQKVEDCASMVTQHTSYCQYLGLTMRGGLVDSRHRPVHTAPSFLTVGAAPFLAFTDRHSEQGGAAALASSVVSSVKSGLFSLASGAMGGLWGGGGEQGPPPDPQVTLGLRHALKDEGRQGLEVLLAPNKMYAAVRDAQNRVMVVETLGGSVVQAWRGYHRVQMAWGVTSLGRGEEEVKQVAVLLLLYLPRRGLLEVWSPEQKIKVTEFQVSQHGLLLRSCLATLDDGVPRRRETIALHAAFLPPSGVLQLLHIPFHALSTSSSAERDLQLQAEIQEVPEGEDRGGRVVVMLLQIKNPALRSQEVWELVQGERRLKQEQVVGFLETIRRSFDGAEESVTIENKLWRSKVHKLFRLSVFYQELVKEEELEEEEGLERSAEEELSHLLATDLEEVAALLAVVPLTLASSPGVLTVDLPDFLSCFELEGSSSSWRAEDPVTTRLRRHLPPALGLRLHHVLSLLCRHSLPSLQDHFHLCGLAPEQFLDLAVAASLHCPQLSVRGLAQLHGIMTFLLDHHANVDDKHRASCQEAVRRALRRALLSPAVYAVAWVWQQVLGCQGSLALGVWAQEWGRRLGHVRAFLRLRGVVERVGGEVGSGHTLASVFEAGDGRVSELVARWLMSLGVDARGLAGELGKLEEGPVQELVTAAGQHFPESCSTGVLVVHLVWEQVQTWSRDRDQVSLLLPSLLPGLWALPCPVLRCRLLSLLWRTFFLKLLQEVARLTETAAKTSASRTRSCHEQLLISPSSVTSLLGLMSQLLDCLLQSSTLGAEQEQEHRYTPLGPEARPHLLDHVLSGLSPDLEAAALQHQLATVLELSWSSEAVVRPSRIFSPPEVAQLLQTQPGLLSSLFADPGVAVGRARAAWVTAVVEGAVGGVHLLPGEGRQYDTKSFQEICSRLLKLARLWFLSDLVRMCQVLFMHWLLPPSQVEQLYRAGLDSLALELSPGVTDHQGLASRCLEVALARVAKVSRSTRSRHSPRSPAPVGRRGPG